jgi:U3 small nucleolar ribonucleoprotein component
LDEALELETGRFEEESEEREEADVGRDEELVELPRDNADAEDDAEIADEEDDFDELVGVDAGERPVKRAELGRDEVSTDDGADTMDRPSAGVVRDEDDVECAARAAVTDAGMFGLAA